MTFTVLIAVSAGVWLLGCAAGLLGIRWSLAPGLPRFGAAVVSSCVALAIGYLGMTHLALAASRTVNGRVQWSLNSKWFFLATLTLGVLALGLTLWKRWKGSVRPPEGE